MTDYSADEIRYLIDLSAELKAAKREGREQQRLAGKEIALIFEKDSTRTRCAFEVAAYDQGAHVTFIGPSGSHMGHKETVKDTARVLGRMYDAIEYRGFGEAIADELAQWAGVPVYNGLTDEWHPTQMLADYLTMREHLDKPYTQMSYCYLGDARFNMANSYLAIGAKLGMDVRIAAPRSLWPDEALVRTSEGFAAESGGRITITEDVAEAVRGCDFLLTDVWVSMGESADVWAERIELLMPYQVNAADDGGDRQPERQVHALPAGVPQRRHRGRQRTRGEVRPDRAGGHRRGLRVRRVDRLRRGREPHAHDQGGHGRHPRKLTMRVVVALGGNALLRRGQALSADNQRENAQAACRALAPLAADHELVIAHGNGPQVGLLALQGSAYTAVETYPLDVLVAQTEGMIGYMLEQELGNVLPVERHIATLLTMIEVDRDDPAMGDPTKPIGPIYTAEEATRLQAEKGWAFKPDGDSMRRVVPSPLPKRIFGTPAIRTLLEGGWIVICAGGGGIPTTYTDEPAVPGRRLEGLEAVIDKDMASALLAADLGADALLIVTDVDAVYENWGTPDQRAIRSATPAELSAQGFAAGSMGPKVQAACWFAERTGNFAAIGSIDHTRALLTGEAGTRVAVETASPTG